MQKITKIAGIDSKFGRKSRTGSTISMEVEDITALEAQQYLMALQQGEEPSGRIKRIELVIYTEEDLKPTTATEMISELEKALEPTEQQKAVKMFIDDENLPANQRELDIYND